MFSFNQLSLYKNVHDVTTFVHHSVDIINLYSLLLFHRQFTVSLKIAIVRTYDKIISSNTCYKGVNQTTYLQLVPR
jgi:hypothetical protein